MVFCVIGFVRYCCGLYNASQKHQSTLLHTNLLNDFFTADHLCKPNIFFEKTLIEICSPHLYASFGTFCVQIGQLFEPQ